MRLPLDEASTMSQSPKFQSWVRDITALCQPEDVVWCDGSDAEYQRVLRIMVQAGTAIPRAPDRRPNSIYGRSHPADVARVEEFTFICSRTAEDAGPTNHWREPGEMKHTLQGLLSGAMRGR